MAMVLFSVLAIITFPFWGIPVIYEFLKIFVAGMKFFFWLFLILIGLKICAAM